jgi:hypothetical protein
MAGHPVSVYRLTRRLMPRMLYITKAQWRGRTRPFSADTSPRAYLSTRKNATGTAMRSAGASCPQSPAVEEKPRREGWSAHARIPIGPFYLSFSGARLPFFDRQVRWGQRPVVARAPADSAYSEDGDIPHCPARQEVLGRSSRRGRNPQICGGLRDGGGRVAMPQVPPAQG